MKCSLELPDVIRSLRINEHAESLAPGWEKNQASLPDGTLPFLERKHVEWAASVAQLPGEIVRLLVETASRVQADDALRVLAWHCERCLPVDDVDFRRWPLPLKALGKKLAGMFYVLVLLSRTRKMLEVFERRNIPDDIRRDTIACLERFIKGGEYPETHGAPGLAPANFNWLRYHWLGVTFRIGRLEFCVHRKFPGRIRAFRNQNTGQVVALAEGGLRFRSDGQMDGANGIFEDPARAWTSHLERSDTEIIGNPIDPKGYAVREDVSLSLKAWKEVLSQESDVLPIHIPPLPPAPMDFEACGNSLARAKQVFPKCFPERTFAAFFCSSWVLDTRLPELLPSSSNIVRFQKEMYLYPRLYKRNGLLFEAIFGKGVANLDAAPMQTSLQRAAAAFLKAGGRFNNGGGCFLLLDDLKWGSRHYRNHVFTGIV